MNTEQQRLVEKYMPLAKKLAGERKKGLPRYIDYEDLESAAYMGLVEAASRYDKTLGVAFSTFAYRRIFGAICDWLRQQGWGKRNEYLSVQSLDCPVGEEGDTFGSLVQAEPDRNNEEIIEHISFILQDDGAKDILQHYFIDELSMREVGDKFGVSESRISQILTKYKARIRSSWEEREFRAELAA